MTKRQREAAERAMLKEMLERNPKLKAQVDALLDLDDDKRKVIDVVAEVLQPKFDDIRMKGILTGWYAYSMRAIKNIENMNTVEEIKAYFAKERADTIKKLGLKPDEEPEFVNIEN